MDGLIENLKQNRESKLMDQSHPFELLDCTDNTTLQLNRALNKLELVQSELVRYHLYLFCNDIITTFELSFVTFS